MVESYQPTSTHMKKKILLMLACLVFTAAGVGVAVATHELPQSPEVAITDVIIPTCGTQAVTIKGTAKYGTDYTTWLYIYSRPIERSYFLRDYATGSMPNPWSFAKTYTPGTYVVKAYVATEGFFNKVSDEVTFTVPATCPCL